MQKYSQFGVQNVRAQNPTQSGPDSGQFRGHNSLNGAGSMGMSHYDVLFSGTSSANLNLPFELGHRSMGFDPSTSMPLKTDSIQYQKDIHGGGYGLEPTQGPGQQYLGEHGPNSGVNRAAGSSQSGSEGANVHGGDKAHRRAQTQKRYREKQASKLSDLERSIQEKTAQLQALTHENEGLRTKERALEKLVSCRDEQLQVLERVRSMCRASGSGSGGCFGPDCASAVEVTPDELVKYKSMTVEDLRTYWRGFITRASALLTSTTVLMGGAAGGSASEIAALVGETGSLMKHVIQLNCPALYMLQQLDLDTGVPSAPLEGHWAKVVKPLDLSPQQQADCVAMFQLYATLMERVLEERRLIKEALSYNAAAKASETREHGMPQYLMAPTPCCFEEMECAEKLYLNLHKERSTRCLLCCFFFGRLLAPIQLARLAVASYPHFPDPLAISREVGRATGVL